MSRPTLSVIVPTYNEAPNVEELVRRVTEAVGDFDAELIYVDDSSDETPDVVRRVAQDSAIEVRLIHRDKPVGGLSGAVIEGIGAARGDWCVVIDGDLQHPPELIPRLVAAGLEVGADVAVASRYCDGGSNDGLADSRRRLVSKGSVALARFLFPRRLHDCTDPMTGFFAFRRDAINLDALHPRGFKILLEILARHDMRVVEQPFTFADRTAGESKATATQGMQFLAQLAELRIGRISRYGLIGAIGALANIAIMAGLMAVGVNYLLAAAVAAGVTILGNFVAQERFVFHDKIKAGRGIRWRFITSVGMNTIEAALRLPLLAVIVELTSVSAVVAQAVTLAIAFVLRYLYHSQFVYREKAATPETTAVSMPARLPLRIDDEQAA